MWLCPYWLAAVRPLDFNQIFDPNKGGRNLITNGLVPLEYCGSAPITPAQTLAPNDITRTRWPRPSVGCSGFSFVRWEEVKPRRPSSSRLEFFHRSTCCAVLRRHHQAKSVVHGQTSAERATFPSASAVLSPLMLTSIPVRIHSLVFMSLQSPSCCLDYFLFLLTFLTFPCFTETFFLFHHLITTCFLLT